MTSQERTPVNIVEALERVPSSRERVPVEALGLGDILVISFVQGDKPGAALFEVESEPRNLDALTERTDFDLTMRCVEGKEIIPGMKGTSYRFIGSMFGHSTHNPSEFLSDCPIQLQVEGERKSLMMPNATGFELLRRNEGGAFEVIPADDPPERVSGARHEILEGLYDRAREAYQRHNSDGDFLLPYSHGPRRYQWVFDAPERRLYMLHKPGPTQMQVCVVERWYESSDYTFPRTRSFAGIHIAGLQHTTYNAHRTAETVEGSVAFSPTKQEAKEAGLVSTEYHSATGRKTLEGYSPTFFVSPAGEVETKYYDYIPTNPKRYARIVDGAKVSRTKETITIRLGETVLSVPSDFDANALGRTLARLGV